MQCHTNIITMNFSLEYISVTQYRKQNVKSDVCSKIIDNKYLLNEQCAERVSKRNKNGPVAFRLCACVGPFCFFVFFPPLRRNPFTRGLGEATGRCLIFFVTLSLAYSFPFSKKAIFSPAPRPETLKRPRKSTAK